MTRPIFLSYRRADSATATARLYAALRDRFGEDSVYMDSSSTAWGEDWPTALERAVAEAEAVVVVMGPQWLLAHDEWGRRRVDQRDDWVRREIAVGIARQKRILPLLLEHAQMPPAHALPDEIAELASKHALRVSDERWDEDVDRVLANLSQTVVVAAPASTTRKRQSSEDEFRTVSARFYDANLRGRLAAAEEIAAIGGLLELDSVLAFAASDRPAERVGAAIALAAHLRMSEALRDDPKVQSALRSLLNDARERVRYRAAEVLRGFPALVPAYQRDLEWLTRGEENDQVRRMAQQALSRAGLSREPA